MTDTIPGPGGAAPARAGLRALALAAVAAAAVDLVVYAVGTSTGASMTVEGTPYTIDAVAVAVASAVPVLIGGVVVLLLARRWPALPGRAAWAGLAFGVVSAASPLLGASDTGTGLTLAAMHVVVGAAWLLALRSVHAAG